MPGTDTRTLILTDTQVRQKVERIAHEINEYNYDEQEIILVGIANRGYLLAERLQTILTAIADFDVRLAKLTLDKDEPLEHPIDLTLDVSELDGKVVLLVDDVLNTGRALIYGVHHLISRPVKMLKTVILVNRRHRRYPIRADYVGLTLATTMKEHIQVEFSEDAGVQVFLV